MTKKILSILLVYFIVLSASSVNVLVLFRVDEDICLETDDCNTELRSINFNCSKTDDIKVRLIQRVKILIDEKMLSYSLDYLLHTPDSPLFWAKKKYKIDYNFETTNRKYIIATFLNSNVDEYIFISSTDESSNFQTLTNLFKFRICKIYKYYKRFISFTNFQNILKEKSINERVKEEGGAELSLRFRLIVFDFILALTIKRIDLEALYNYILGRFIDFYILMVKENSKEIVPFLFFKLKILSNQDSKKKMMIWINDKIQNFEFFIRKDLKFSSQSCSRQEYLFIEYNKFTSVKTFRKVLYLDFETSIEGTKSFKIIFFDKNNKSIQERIDFDVISNSEVLILLEDLKTYKVEFLCLNCSNFEDEILINVRKYLK